MEFTYPYLILKQLQIGIKPVAFIILLIVLLVVIKLLKKDVDMEIRWQFIDIENNYLNSTLILISILSYLWGNVLFQSESIIYKPANIFLQYETLIGIVIILMILYGKIFVKNNFNTFFNQIIKIVKVYLILILISALITKQLPFNAVNVIYLIVIVFIVLSEIDICNKENIENYNNLLSPIKNSDDLFSNNEVVQNRLKIILRENKNKNISICVSGKWGSGKTSVVKSLFNSDEFSNYFVIEINVLELDNLESLFKYFFSKIETLLKSEGVYVGVNSEIKTFVISSIDLVTSKNISSLIGYKKDNLDYREEKEKLNLLLSKIEKNIVVIVDDIERVEKEKAKDFIFFTKEIATFDRCASIFLTDSNILSENLKVDIDYLDKFFNYMIQTSSANIEETIQYYKEKNVCEINQKIEFDIFKSISFFERLHSVENTDLEKSQSINARYTEKIKELNSKCQSHKVEFKDNLSNPRKLIKICNAYYNKARIINNTYTKLDSNNQDDFLKYITNINWHHCIFLLAYTEICDEKTYQKIIKDTMIDSYYEFIDNIKSKFMNEENISYALDNYSLIYNSFDNLFDENNDRDIEYLRLKALEFIDLITQRDSLEDIYTAISSKDEECFCNLEANTLSSNKSEILDCFMRVLRNKEKFSEVKFEKYVIRIINKIIVEFDMNTLFSTFYVPKTYLSYPNIYLSKFVRNQILELKSETDLGISVYEEIQGIYKQYISFRIASMVELLDLIIEDKGTKDEIWHSHKILTDDNINYSENIKRYLRGIIEVFDDSYEDEKLRKTKDEALQYCIREIEKKVEIEFPSKSNFPDMYDIIDKINRDMQEIILFVKIMEDFNVPTNYVNIKVLNNLHNINLNEIDKTLDNFEKAASLKIANSEFYTYFEIFLKQVSEISIYSENVNVSKIDSIIKKYYEENTNKNVIALRAYSQKIKKNQKSILSNE